MRYHPDRNHGNHFAIQHFQEVQEAYDILSNPVKRNEYHQQRWVEHPFQKRQPIVLRAEDLLMQAKAIEKKLGQIDVFRMDQPALQRELEQLLNSHHLSLLETTDGSNTNAELFQSLLRSANKLPNPLLQEIHLRLIKVAGTDNKALLQLQGFMAAKKRQYFWDKYKGFIVLLIALALCAIIYSIA